MMACNHEQGQETHCRLVNVQPVVGAVHARTPGEALALRIPVLKALLEGKESP